MGPSRTELKLCVTKTKRAKDGIECS